MCFPHGHPKIECLPVLLNSWQPATRSAAITFRVDFGFMRIHLGDLDLQNKGEFTFVCEIPRDRGLVDGECSNSGTPTLERAFGHVALVPS